MIALGQNKKSAKMEVGVGAWFLNTKNMRWAQKMDVGTVVAFSDKMFIVARGSAEDILWEKLGIPTAKSAYQSEVSHFDNLSRAVAYAKK